jgi:hypothetical protein
MWSNRQWTRGYILLLIALICVDWAADLHGALENILYVADVGLWIAGATLLWVGWKQTHRPR